MRGARYIVFFLLLLFVYGAATTEDGCEYLDNTVLYTQPDVTVQPIFKAAGPRLDISKPQVRVRYRPGEVGFELGGIPQFTLPRVFYTVPEYFDSYSFHLCDGGHAIQLRGPPAC